MPRLFEYTARNTFVHRLNSASRIILIFSCLILLSVYYDPYYLLAVGAVVVLVYLVSKTPKKWIAIPAVIVAFRWWDEYLVTGVGLYDPSLFKVWPKTLVAHVLIQIPFPVVGKLTLITGAALYVLAYSARVFLGALITFVLVYTTPLNDYVKLMRKAKVPNFVTFVLATGLKLVPDLLRLSDTITTAQKLRGGGMKTRNPIKAVRQAYPFVVPLSRRTIELVDRMTLSSQIRGFGTAKAATAQEIKLNLKRVDYLVVIVSVGMLALALYLYFFYNMGSL